MKKHKTALVTGATGAIGPKLVHELLRRGWTVKVLVRDQTKLSSTGAEPVLCDLTAPQNLESAMKEVDTVFHLAAKLHINSPSASLKSEYKSINVEATSRLLDAASSANVSRFIFFSTINVYGPSAPGQCWDEDARLNPDSIYAETKIEAEELVKKFPGNSVLRMAAVFGPGMKGNYVKLVQALKRGRFFFVGDGLNRRSLIYVDDSCSAAILAAEEAQSAGRIYNVTDGSTPTLRNIVEEICGALQRRVPSIKMPLGLARISSSSVDGILKLAGRPRFRNMVEKLVEDVAVNGSRIQSEIGFKPACSQADGWKAVVESMYFEK